MKSLKSIGKDVLRKIFPKTVEFGFKSETIFYDHTLDIHRRIENIYSNITRDFKNSETHVVALRFKVWGMELGIVDIPLVVTAQDEASDKKSLRKDLIDLICKCDRIKQTSFAPTHLIASITTEGNKWKRLNNRVYCLEKWQSDEIVNTAHK